MACQRPDVPGPCRTRERIAEPPPPFRRKGRNPETLAASPRLSGESRNPEALAARPPFRRKPESRSACRAPRLSGESRNPEALAARPVFPAKAGTQKRLPPAPSFRRRPEPRSACRPPRRSGEGRNPEALAASQATSSYTTRLRDADICQPRHCRAPVFPAKAGIQKRLPPAPFPFLYHLWIPALATAPVFPAKAGIQKRLPPDDFRFLSLVKFPPADSQVSSDSMNGSRSQVPVAMFWNGSLPVVGRVNPDFVRTARLTVQGASQPSELPC